MLFGDMFGISYRVALCCVPGITTHQHQHQQLIHKFSPRNPENDIARKVRPGQIFSFENYEMGQLYAINSTCEHYFEAQVLGAHCQKLDFLHLSQ